MARVKPFRRIEIDAGICAKITRIMEANRYRGSFTSFVESILDLYGDGLLRKVGEESAEGAGTGVVIGATFGKSKREQRKAS